MKKILGFILVALITLSLPLTAQNRARFGGYFNAVDFAYGVNPNIPALISDSNNTGTGSQTITLRIGQISLSDGTNVTPISISMPLRVGTGATSEVVTPTAVSCATPSIQDSCTFSASFTYAHGYGEPIRSATVGLGEALNEAESGLAYYTSPYNGGGVAIIDQKWVQYGGTNAMIALIPIQADTAIEDLRGFTPIYWTPQAIATTIIGVPTTLTAVTAAPSSTPAGLYTTGTYHLCIAYVDITGQEGACSADFSEAGVATGSFIFSPPAASAGAVGYTVYISLTGGTYTLMYKVPLVTQPTVLGAYPVANGVCTLTLLENTTPACAVANSTFNQAGATATVTAITVATSPTAINSAVISTSAITHGNTTARTTYGYTPGSAVGLSGVPSNVFPAATSAAAGSTIPSAIGTINLPPGFLNFPGKKVRVCGYGTFSGASTATVLNMSLQWDAFGQNNAGLPVTVANTAATPSAAFAASVVNVSFCFTIAGSVQSVSATGGSIIPLNAQVTWGNTATGISPASGGLITTAAVGSLNLAGESRLHIVYNHTTGTDGTGMVLNGYTIEAL